ncbi:formyltetrahydrofolate deformylase [Specibacter cremeus]|uniref:formyltetrahydrofolate deformylase n=1 Tax=Specibacter cremeus TaxID=1629051 RepID=UPI000F770B81|nr:formyltetrahydrofolate deformylase [Specibacter cremeus]
MTSTLAPRLDSAPSRPDAAVVPSTYVLTLSCLEQPGIVHAVTKFLADRLYDIVEHQQFDDSRRGVLYLRTVFAGTEGPASAADLAAEFSLVARDYDMDFQFHDERVPRIAVMVSKFGHCLNDLIYRWRSGTLGADIAMVISNHEDLRQMAESAGLPFIHVPVTAESKPAAEARLLELIAEYQIDLVVLARYMQVLSDALCTRLAGRAINIHHSFLPGFKGARPYHQAYDRGVKQVGATAHYVTGDLDEGPIIEQEVIRVDHRYGPAELTTAGQDAESQALARAVRWHAQHRVMITGNSTIVFK